MHLKCVTCEHGAMKSAWQTVTGYRQMQQSVIDAAATAAEVDDPARLGAAAGVSGFADASLSLDMPVRPRAPFEEEVGGKHADELAVPAPGDGVGSGKPPRARS